MTEPHDRLRQLRIKKGYETPSDAARAFGWNEHTYKSHENGIRGMKAHVARKYAQAFGTTASFLMYGDGNGAVDINQAETVPLVGEASAGVFLESRTVGEEDVRVPVVPRKDIPGGAQYALRVVGDSVNLKIADGSFAICAPYDKFPGGAEHGSLVHVVRERSGLQEHTIKEIRFTKDGPALFPVSNNPKHQEPIIPNGDDDTTVRIHGVVIGSYTPL